MANTRSAIKRMKQSERRRIRTRGTRSQVRSAVKTARTVAEAKGPDAVSTMRAAIRAIDKAVTRGVIHGTPAARRKASRSWAGLEWRVRLKPDAFLGLQQVAHALLLAFLMIARNRERLL